MCDDFMLVFRIHIPSQNLILYSLLGQTKL